MNTFDIDKVYNDMDEQLENTLIHAVETVKENETSRADGGQGSGNFGHAGRPGLVGGSGEGGSPKEKKPVATKEKTKYIQEREVQHVQERSGEIVNRGTPETVGAEDRGGDTGSGEGEGVNIRGSVEDGGRIVATHHLENGNVYEIDNPQFYHNNLKPLIIEHEYGACVTLHPTEHYANARTFVSSDGRSCFAITKEGDLQSVIRMGDSKFTSDNMLDLAVRQGAKTLDCFDTILPATYKKFGFKETGRMKWDDQFKPTAPKEWDYNLYKKFNDGRPAVVEMKREE